MVTVPCLGRGQAGEQGGCTREVFFPSSIRLPEALRAAAKAGWQLPALVRPQLLSEAQEAGLARGCCSPWSSAPGSLVKEVVTQSRLQAHGAIVGFLSLPWCPALSSCPRC